MDPSKKRRSHRLGARLGLALASFVVTLAVCELVARLVGDQPQIVEVEGVEPRTTTPGAVSPVEEERGINVVIDWSGDRGVRLRPNVRATIRNHLLSGRDIVIQTSSLGLRHDELAAKTPDELRVLVLGDSITFADYVPYDETYTARIEDRLAGRSRHVTVINAGLPGASTAVEFYQYLELRDAVDPDLVLLAMYLNDAQRSSMFYVRALPRPYSSSRFASWLASRVAGLRRRLWIDRAVDDIDPAWREGFRRGRDLKTGDMLNDPDARDFEVYNAAMDFGLGWNEQAWVNLGRQVEVLSLAADEAGHDLALSLFPVHFQVRGSLEDAFPQERFLDMCADLGLPCLDLLPALRADPAAGGDALFYDHCHLTPRGNEVVAEAISAWLVERGLVP